MGRLALNAYPEQVIGCFLQKLGGRGTHLSGYGSLLVADSSSQVCRVLPHFHEPGCREHTAKIRVGLHVSSNVSHLVRFVKHDTVF
jgi:hypothetical protein